MNGINMSIYYKAISKCGYLLGYTSCKESHLKYYKEMGWKKNQINYIKLKKK